MDSLIARADAVQPLQKKRKTLHGASKKPSSNSKPPTTSSSDQTLNSVAKRTSVPKSLKDKSEVPEDAKNYNHIANKKLRTQLNRQSTQGARAKALLEDADMLLMEDAGGMEVEGEMDRTWRVGQSDILNSTGQEAGKGRREYKLDGGPYRSRYTRNGRYVFKICLSTTLLTRIFRHLAIVGHSGHVSTFDWQAGTMHAELQLQETCRDITYVCHLEICTD